MQGIALYPTTVFPREGSVLVTESSLYDKEIFGKLKSFMMAGGKVFVTPGFMAKAPAEEWREISSAYLTGRKLSVTRYYKTDDPAGYLEDVSPVSFADIQHSNNLSWSLLNGGAGEYHSTLFLKDTYGKGKMFLVNVPENPSDLSKIPGWAMDAVKQEFNYDGIYVTAPNVSIFHYDNGTFILYAHVTGHAHPVRATIHIQSENAKLLQYFAPWTPSGEKEIELTAKSMRYDLKRVTEMTGEVILNPGEFYEFKVTKE